VTSTTLKPGWAIRNDLNDNLYYSVESNSRASKAAELAIIIGGVTILIMILAVVFRICYFVYNKVRKLASPVSASVVYRSKTVVIRPIVN